MPGPTVLTIGNFDGVHLGHQAILARARAIAGPAHARVIALTFDPHPAAVLRPGSEPARLSTREHKAERLRATGADDVVILEPTPELLGQTAEQFVANLVATYRPVAFVEGADFRFGKGRAGNVERLAAMGGEHGFEVQVVDRVDVALADRQLAPVSSSLVRWLVEHGRVMDAALALNAGFELRGRVAAGEQRGRTLGVPTANLDPADYAGHVLPADGVYAGAVVLPDAAVRPAALSVGVKPTFGEHRLTIEAHLLDFAGDLYGQSIAIRFARWIRDQHAFPDLASLKRQLDQDIAQTRRGATLGLLDTPRPVAHAG
ncbi:MAG: riboflavin biosynthesis protein RibF [Phycisphaeraceae bacterium]